MNLGPKNIILGPKLEVGLDNLGGEQVGQVRGGQVQECEGGVGGEEDDRNLTLGKYGTGSGNKRRHSGTFILESKLNTITRTEETMSVK